MEGGRWCTQSLIALTTLMVVAGTGRRAARDGGSTAPADGRSDPPRRRAHRGGVAAGPGGHRVPAARSERRRRRHVRDRGPHRLRRHLSVRRRHRASIRSRRRSSATAPAATSGSPSDWIRVMIDSFHDRRSAFEFAVNPAGVKQDTYWFNDANSDEGWDAVWDVSVVAHAGRLARRVPDSVLAAPLPADRVDDVRAGVRAADRAPQRDLDLAAALEERDRLRVVVRRADRPPARSHRSSVSRWCRISSAT